VLEEYELQARSSVQEIGNEIGCEGVEFKELKQRKMFYEMQYYFLGD
jgi:hypothetical protein